MGILFPHIIGLILLVAGWMVSMGSVQMTINFGSQSIISMLRNSLNEGSLIGLALIMVGALLPDFWLWIRRMVVRKAAPPKSVEPPKA